MTYLCMKGSKFSSEKNAGAGIYLELFAFLGKNATTFRWRSTGHQYAAKPLNIRDKYFKKAVILSDSISAIQAIISFKIPDSRRIEDCRKDLKQLEESGKEELHGSWFTLEFMDSQKRNQNSTSTKQRNISHSNINNSKEKKDSQY
ncbi:hypothetical protein TNCT_598231 [Trichonephila clavata]|uniref:Uncharacterized protein n=1 Tax=Trichonephila clavata TaxID=2740835 RepID=A0A8X6F514_TRICU|nr:hypothetical protein TNCT_598231 [Trichonephila clavata]